MLFIQKIRTPLCVKEEAKRIMQTPDNGYKSIQMPRDTEQLRSLFDMMPKKEIREALCKEQHGLCAYCMRAIRPERSEDDEKEADLTKIEHYVALSKDKGKALDYKNYLGVCYGGEHDVSGAKKESVILHCDASRTDRRLTINPWNRRQMEAIGYERNGKIFVRTDVGLEPGLAADMQTDIDEELMLNGKMNDAGKVIFDTVSKLVTNRKRIYDSTCTQFERWAQKGCLTSEYLKEKIEVLERQLGENQTADSYIGVRIYFYRRKYDKLRRMESH